MISDFNKIVKILSKKRGKILFKEDIYELIDPEHKKIYQSKVDKIIYKLKAQKKIISIKSGVYIIPSLADEELNSIELIEKYFFQLLKKYIIKFCGSDYYISGNKALEIHDKNFSLPEKIYIVTRATSKRVQVGNYEIIFKTLKGKYQGKSYNLYPKFELFCDKKTIEGYEFKIAGLELALLETAILTDIEEALAIKLLQKMLKKYSSVLRAEVFFEIGKYKYIMSFNRLKEIAKKVDESWYIVFLEVIKQNGGLFIGEGLRGF